MKRRARPRLPKPVGQSHQIVHLGLVRRPAQRHPPSPQPLQRLPIRLIPLLSPVAPGPRRPLPLDHRRSAQQIAPTAVTVDQEALLRVLVPEHVEHARRHRDRLLVQGRLEESLDLRLRVVLLKGAAPGQHPVPEALPLYVVLVGEHHRHDQKPLRQRPGTGQGFQPLVEVLDDIDDEAQVDDVRRRDRIVRRVVRVPTPSLDTVLDEPSHVVAPTAAVVEHPQRAIQKAVPRQRLHRCRKPIPRERRPMPGHFPSDMQRHLFLPCPRLSPVIVPDRHELVSDDLITLLPHQLLPLAPVPDARRLIEQPNHLTRLGQRSKLRLPRMVLGRSSSLRCRIGGLRESA